MQGNSNTIFVPVLIFLLSSCRDDTIGVSDNKNLVDESRHQSVELVAIQHLIRHELAKEVSVTQLVTVADGGRLVINHSFQGVVQKNVVTVDVNLRVPPRALDEDRYLTMRLNDSFLGGSVDVTFAPHGTDFRKNALLDIHATGLDLSSIPLHSKLGLYYFDPETGSYKKMRVGELTYDLDKGEIICEDGELPHFSEYAFGYIKK